MCCSAFVPGNSAVAVPLADLPKEKWVEIESFALFIDASDDWEIFAEEGMRKEGLFNLLYVSNRLSSRKRNMPERKERFLIL